jgi:SPP1 gp7 family putative phage head morphogenesis protein
MPILENSGKFYANEFDKELVESGELVAYQWSSIIDRNTTEGCRKLDGIIYSVDNPAWKKLRCPRHEGCRSVLTTIFQGEEFEDNKDIGVCCE